MGGWGGGVPACDSSVRPRGPRQRRRGGAELGSAAPEELSSRGLSPSSLLSLAPSEDFEASSRMPTEHMLRLRLGNILFSSVHQIFMEPRQGHRQAQPLRVSVASCSSCVLTGQGPGRSSPLSTAVGPSVQETPPALTLRFQPRSVSVTTTPSHATEGEEGKASAAGILRCRPISPRGHGVLAEKWRPQAGPAATASRPPVSGSSALFLVPGRSR